MTGIVPIHDEHTEWVNSFTTETFPFSQRHANSMSDEGFTNAARSSHDCNRSRNNQVLCEPFDALVLFSAEVRRGLSFAPNIDGVLICAVAIGILVYVVG